MKDQDITNKRKSLETKTFRVLHSASYNTLPPLYLWDNFVPAFIKFCYLMHNTNEISAKFLRKTDLIFCAELEAGFM